MMKRLSGTFRRRPDPSTTTTSSSSSTSCTGRAASVLGTHNQETASAAAFGGGGGGGGAPKTIPSKLPEPKTRARARANAASSRQQQKQHLALQQQQHHHLPQRQKDGLPPKHAAAHTDRSKSMSYAAAHVIVRGTATLRTTSTGEPAQGPGRQASMPSTIPPDRPTGKSDIPFFSDAPAGYSQISGHPGNHPNACRPDIGSGQHAGGDVSALRPPKNPSVLVRRVSGVRTGLRGADSNAPDAAVIEQRTHTAPDMLSTAKPAKYPRQQTFAPGLSTQPPASRDFLRQEQVVTGNPRTASPVQRSRSPSPPSPSVLDVQLRPPVRPATERRRPARWAPSGAMPSSFSAISQRRDKAEARSLGSACGSLEREIASIEQQARDSASNIDIAAFLETRASALRQILANLEDRYDSIEAYYVKGREYAQAMGRFYQVSPEEYERWSRGSRSSSLSASRRPSTKSNRPSKDSPSASIVQPEGADQLPVLTYMR